MSNRSGQTVRFGRRATMKARSPAAATALALLAAASLFLVPPMPACAGIIGDVPLVVFGPVGVAPGEGVRLAVSWMAVAGSDAKDGGLPLGLLLVGPDGTVLAQQTVTLELGKTAVLELPPAGQVEAPAPSPNDYGGDSSTQVTGVLLADPRPSPSPIDGLAASMQLYDGLDGSTKLSVHPGGVDFGLQASKPTP